MAQTAVGRAAEMVADLKTRVVCETTDGLLTADLAAALGEVLEVLRSDSTASDSEVTSEVTKDQKRLAKMAEARAKMRWGAGWTGLSVEQQQNAVAREGLLILDSQAHPKYAPAVGLARAVLSAIEGD